MERILPAPRHRLVTMLRTVLVILAALLLTATMDRGDRAQAAETSDAEAPESVRQVTSRLLADLDSPAYSTRQRAAAELADLVAQPDLAEPLAAEFQRVLMETDLSFEVRWQIKRLAGRLPEVPLQPPRPVSPEELDRVVRQLDADSYAVRLGAGQRLDWLLGHPKNAVPMLVRIKQRLTDPGLSEATERQLRAALEVARGAWLLSDPEQWVLPEVGREEIVAWVDDLAEGTEPARRAAEQELKDVLARDDHVDTVRRLLEERLADEPRDPTATAAMKRLVDLTRPAMVAEYWSEHRHLGEQHLLVGVPSMSAGSIRPSHFDAIDNEEAYCVSGSNLSRGKYPVGVAIPHPNQENAFFHLVNLPNPRRRMAYTFRAKVADEVRLGSISKRTLSRWIEEKIPLGEPELITLAQLDAGEVSRFAGKYFFVVEDEQLPPSGRRRLGGRPSRFGMLCGQLAKFGTHEAIPGLLKAIDERRFLPPTSMAPYRLHWLAALAIALRDPWPEVDAWLAETIRRDVILIEGDADAAQLGATAAGILLERHDQRPSAFGLRPAPAAELIKLAVDGYRFPSEDARAKVLTWWQGEKDRKQQP